MGQVSRNYWATGSEEERPERRKKECPSQMEPAHNFEPQINRQRAQGIVANESSSPRVRFSFPREPIASVLRLPGRRPPGFWIPPRGSPKKSRRDFATLASLGHFALRSA